MKYIKPKKLIRSLTLPVMFLVVFLVVNLVWKFFHLPETEHLIAIVEYYFEKFGIIVLFISAFIEGALILGFYYPGAIVIFLSVIVAGQDIGAIIQVVTLVIIAFVLGLSLDYLVGKYGWYRLFLKLGFKNQINEAQEKIKKHALLAILSTYWDINLASFTATAAGILNFPYRKFFLYSLFGLVIWDSFWATVIYFLGPRSIDLVTGKSSFGFWVIGSWIGLVIIKHIWDNWRITPVKERI